MPGRKMCIMFPVAKATQNYMRGYGAAGSAPAWHAGGQGFESPYLHTIDRLVRKDWAVFYYFSNSTWCFHMNVPLARNSICPLHEIIVRRDKRGMAITPNNTFKNLAKILKRV